ncbi:unnamed protein product [Amoebophrya sp. A25]|nr:unnamed protein product [Amoebophrya sp. A25]|eukprot:GSA25T00012521001.1
MKLETNILSQVVVLSVAALSELVDKWNEKIEPMNVSGGRAVPDSAGVRIGVLL